MRAPICAHFPKSNLRHIWFCRPCVFGWPACPYAEMRPASSPGFADPTPYKNIFKSLRQNPAGVAGCKPESLRGCFVVQPHNNHASIFQRSSELTSSQRLAAGRFPWIGVCDLPAKSSPVSCLHMLCGNLLGRAIVLSFIGLSLFRLPHNS